MKQIHNIGKSGVVIGQHRPTLKSGKLTCSHCKKKYVTKESLNSHIERDHIRSTCEHCGKVFNSDNYLATHIQRKHSSKQFHCDQCEYSTSMKRDLKYHMESKHENTTHVCEECGKSYSHKNILAMHMKEKHGDVQSHFQIMTYVITLALGITAKCKCTKTLHTARPSSFVLFVLLSQPQVLRWT